jgi:protein-S-isoprenylcysteine O-methyltransferase Ste14
MARKRVRREQERQRTDLSGEHALADAGQLVLACLFFTVWALDTFALNHTIWLNNHVPLAVRIPLGLVFLAVSGYLAKTGLSIVFGEKRDKPGVIRKSVFGIIRHPIYLSEIVLYLGFITMSLSLSATLIWCIAVLFLHHISRHEEELLLARFGDEYAQYMREVPMWFPRLWK